jgi:RNA polymerase sigma factor (sigma-70 family)
MLIMKFQREEIKFEMEKALKSLLEARGTQGTAGLGAIFQANLDRGRVEVFVGEELARADEYVRHVADQYKKLNPYLTAVQIERTPEVWTPLFKKLQTWAYNFLLRKNFFPGLETRAIAEERATDAAMQILEAYFPYDIEFEPWAHVIVTNTCLRFFRDETKKSIVPSQKIVELDEKLPGPDDPSWANQESRSELLKAMAQLPDARRQVIQYHYLDELSLPEIAKSMGKSVGAVHSLHFNALQDLRKILDKNRNNT